VLNKSETNDKRQYKRYKIDEKEILVKLAFANEVKIYDISLGGISLRADRRINIGKEYLLKLKYRENEISAKGIVVWSVLSQSEADQRGNVIPIYSCGLKFDSSSNEKIKQFIDLIEKDSMPYNEQKDISPQKDDFIDISVQFRDVLEVFQ
jgi:hypothetical protein